jgi:hypothetical protein
MGSNEEKTFVEKKDECTLDNPCKIFKDLEKDFVRKLNRNKINHKVLMICDLFS